MEDDSHESDSPLVPFLGLGWLIAVAALSEYRLLDWNQFFLTSVPAFIVLGCFACGVTSFLAQRLNARKFRIATIEFFVLIAFIAVALSNLPVGVAIGVAVLAIDSFELKSAKAPPTTWVVLVKKIGAVLGSVYLGAHFAQLLTYKVIQ